MKNKEKNKPAGQDQSDEQQKVNQQKGKQQPPVNPQEEEERNDGLEKTHQSEHQPLPGEGTDEAKGKADEETGDGKQDRMA